MFILHNLKFILKIIENCILKVFIKCIHIFIWLSVLGGGPYFWLALFPSHFSQALETVMWNMNIETSLVLRRLALWNFTHTNFYNETYIPGLSCHQKRNRSSEMLSEQKRSRANEKTNPLSLSHFALISALLFSLYNILFF
jgi:hypothetical protein